MATSAVQVCSNALLLLGAQTINAFTDNSDRAKLVSNLWANCRDAVLRSHPWNCAVEIVQLAPDATTPAFDWTYQFTLPGDCLRILSVGEEGETPEYRVRRRKILCDENPLNLTYLYRNEDVASWDSLLVEAMTAYMAMTCAYPITKSASVQEQMASLYKFKLQQAKAVDGQEQPPEQMGDFPFMDARVIG
jgi:hypothetical protein